MGKFQVLLIRTGVVIAVALLVRILGSGLDFDAIIDELIYLGIPMFLGLLIFSVAGPKDSSRVHAAVYPVLYGWVVYFLLQNFDSNQARSFTSFWKDGIFIPIGFVVAIPAIYVLDLVWKPKKKSSID